MNYKLAKQLKDAGFPQDRDYGYVYLEPWQGPIHIYDFCCSPETDGKDYVYVPTLSELIEACKDSFMMIRKDPSRDKPWCAYGIKDSYPSINDCDTAEEAVANLWLKL